MSSSTAPQVKLSIRSAGCESPQRISRDLLLIQKLFPHAVVALCDLAHVSKAVVDRGHIDLAAIDGELEHAIHESHGEIFAHLQDAMIARKP